MLGVYTSLSRVGKQVLVFIFCQIINEGLTAKVGYTNFRSKSGLGKLRAKTSYLSLTYNYIKWLYNNIMMNNNKL